MLWLELSYVLVVATMQLQGTDCGNFAEVHLTRIAQLDSAESSRKTCHEIFVNLVSFTKISSLLTWCCVTSLADKICFYASSA